MRHKEYVLKKSRILLDFLLVSLKTEGELLVPTALQETGMLFKHYRSHLSPLKSIGIEQSMSKKA